VSGAPGPPDQTGAVLALDLGDARIGVAVSDPDGRVAVPVGTVRTGAPEDLRAISAIARERSVATIVVGHPLSMSGEAGPSARHAEEFADALRAFTGIPVVLHDERLSTVEAERALREAGVAGRDRRRVVDRTAAVVILRSYLDARRRATG
jgi:putative Holliday junction resolvase